MKAEVLQQFQGCLVGVAVGDALGMPVEGWTREWIRDRFGCLRELVDGPLPAGSITDDTQQTLLLAESLVERGEFEAEDVVQRLVRWYQSRPFGIGAHTRKVLQLIAQGMSWQQATEEVERQDAPWTAGNGSLMRCAPIALRYYRDISALLDYSHQSSALTHPNLLARTACAFFNAVLSRVLRGWEKKESLSFAMELMAHAPHELLDRVKGIENKAADELGVSGFVLDTLEVALWAWWHHDDFEEALVAVVNLGGDADTNGAVTGALMGAQVGIEAIPLRWRQRVAVLDRCLSLAEGLYRLAHRD